MLKRLYVCKIFLFLTTLAANSPELTTYLSGSLLYWQSHEGGLSFVTQPSSVFTTTDYTTTSLVGPNFAWKPGFRLTADFAFPCSDWALGMHWICYNGSAAKSIAAPSFEGMFPALSINEGTLVGDFATGANMTWKLKSNILDLLAETTASWKDRFALGAMLGLRSAWFYQSIHTTYHGGSFNAGPDLVEMKSHFYGIGPRVGLVPIAFLPCNFSIYGGGGASFFYGFFSVKESEEFVGVEVGSIHRSPQGFRWNGDAKAGLLWAYNFRDPCLTLIVDVGGDYLFFNRQNAFRRAEVLGNPHKTDLSLYGVHGSLCLQF
jgi:hypothetical protein